MMTFLSSYYTFILAYDVDDAKWGDLQGVLLASWLEICAHDIMARNYVFHRLWFIYLAPSILYKKLEALHPL